MAFPRDHDVRTDVALVAVVGCLARRGHEEVMVGVRGDVRDGVKEHEATDVLGIVGQVRGSENHRVQSGSWWDVAL